MSAPLESTGLLHGSSNQGFPRYSQPTGPTFTRAVYPIYNNPFTPGALAAADKRARRRFALTLILGFLLWLILGLFIGVVGGEGAWWGDRPYDSRWPGALEPIPDSDGDVSHCADFLKNLPTSVIVVPPADKGHFIIPPHAPSASSLSSQQSGYVSDYDEVVSGAGGDWGGGDDGHQRTIYKSRVFFHLPITSADGLFTLARGQYSSGPIKFVLEEPHASKDSPSDKDEAAEDHVASSSSSGSSSSIEVEVTARWNDKELLKSSKVCALTKHANSTHHHTERGIGIYTPSHEVPGAYRHLSFETVVRIPPKGLESLKSLALFGPMFAPVDIDLAPVTFSHASFNTSNGSIHVLSALSASIIEMKTSNGAIDGNFSVSDKLLLTSSNGRIDAHVALAKGREAGEDTATSSDIEVKAHTTNGNAYVRYTKHPQDVVLASSVKTTNGDAAVTHQPAFEGRFSLSTSWGKGLVHSSSKSTDPTGRKRKRKLEITDDQSNFGTVKKEGRIYWQEEEHRKKDEQLKGESVVQTSLGTASLEFL
ncbi:hypothetical protein P389DRAFT_165404 [Cystobasidium minutum MCA 4210]|uniref:uncharacterized protein n=1 Tax=Cystobasidium minutum MCA 4210 TaxID=1397322 RepID=UPI0034CE3603|eukprot:jgi/Rhomi1/165404/fgenesh1_kg.1_\